MFKPAPKTFLVNTQFYDLPGRLNIGCSCVWNGDVNLDDHRPCNIIADAHKLPFKKESFNQALLHHVLEHVKDPVKVLDEAMRVSKTVNFTVPIRWHPYAHRDPNHKWFFPSSWFREYARSRDLNYLGRLNLDTERHFLLFGVQLCGYFWRKN